LPGDDLVEVYLLEFFKAVDLEEQPQEEYAAFILLEELWDQMTPAQRKEINQTIGIDPPWVYKKGIQSS
jgi:hypothetical protein